MLEWKECSIDSLSPAWWRWSQAAGNNVHWSDLWPIISEPGPAAACCCPPSRQLKFCDVIGWAERRPHHHHHQPHCLGLSQAGGAVRGSTKSLPLRFYFPTVVHSRDRARHHCAAWPPVQWQLKLWHHSSHSSQAPGWTMLSSVGVIPCLHTTSFSIQLHYMEMENVVLVLKC